jgi:hypothetical protein
MMTDTEQHPEVEAVECLRTGTFDRQFCLSRIVDQRPRLSNFVGVR